MQTVLEKVKNYTQEFESTFGVPLPPFTDQVLAMFGIYGFDIIRFDEFMHKKGYTEEEHGCLNNYISIRYSTRASKLIEELLGVS